MATNKFTPGPWYIDESYHTSINDAPADRRHKHIAMVNFYNSKNPYECVDEEEHQANVNLIAASPDLFSACEAALKLAEAMSESDLYDQIKNAIAKAKGEQ